MEYINNNRKISFTTYLEDKDNVTAFRHFKNKEYIIITLGKDSETGEDVVCYQALYDDKKYWVRDAKMFFSVVDHEKYPDVEQIYRFEKISK